MKLLPQGKIARVVAVLAYLLLAFALVLSLGGLKNSFRRGIQGSIASPVSQASGAPHVGVSQSAGTSTPSASAVSSPPAESHIHFVVYGAPDATVTIEADGNTPVHVRSNSSIRWPLDPNVTTYTLSSALQGSGTTTVKIFIDGKLLSVKTATGGVNIAIAGVVKNQHGTWVGIGD